MLILHRCARETVSQKQKSLLAYQQAAPPWERTPIGLEIRYSKLFRVESKGQPEWGKNLQTLVQSPAVQCMHNCRSPGGEKWKE